MEGSQRGQESLNSTDTYSKLIVPTVGLILTILALLFGSGLIQTTFGQPRIITTTSRLAFDNQVLNSCYVRNDGRANADNVVIQLNSEKTIPFATDLEVYGAEGQWNVIAGKTGDNYARIELDRLASTHILTVTAATALPTSFDCQVSFQGGSVIPARSSLSLSIWDYVLLIGVNIATIIISYVVWRKMAGRNNN